MVHPYTRFCATFDYVGCYSYFLTFVTVDRQEAFVDAIVVDLVRTQIWRAASEKQFEILVSCFMPDHLHLVVRGLASDSNLKAFVKIAKQYAGFYYAQTHSGRKLWQHGIHDRIVRDEVELLDHVRYVVNNPVAAGLADRPEDYPFLSSQRWLTPELVERCRTGTLE